jgi:hypothetical protein
MQAVIVIIIIIIITTTTTTMIKRQILDMYIYANANWCNPSIPASQSNLRQPKNKRW